MKRQLVPRWIKAVAGLLLAAGMLVFMNFTQAHVIAVQVCSKQKSADTYVLDTSIGELTVRQAVIGEPIDEKSVYDAAQAGRTYMAYTYGFRLWPNGSGPYVYAIEDTNAVPHGQCQLSP